MPCTTDPPSQTEIEHTKVKKFLREVSQETVGSHDDRVVRLCEWCRTHPKSLQKQSLELQIWWRDHQAVDARHMKEEKEENARAVLRKSGLDKLTPAERKALGLD